MYKPNFSIEQKYYLIVRYISIHSLNYPTQKLVENINLLLGTTQVTEDLVTFCYKNNFAAIENHLKFSDSETTEFQLSHTLLHLK